MDETVEHFYEGGCFCGLIRYEITGKPFNVTNCHCSICRKTTGAPYVAWLTVKKEEFRITQGFPTLFKSTQTGQRNFCGNCGTQLTFEVSNEPSLIDVTLCSLDDQEAVQPTSHTFVSSKLNWVHIEGSDIPRHAEFLPRQRG